MLSNSATSLYFIPPSLISLNTSLAWGARQRKVTFPSGKISGEAGDAGMGGRAAGDPVLYVGWLMMVAAVFYVPVAVGLKGTVLFRASPRAWGVGLVAGACSFGAYAIAVWAMSIAPIALVAALRETSILFAMLIGWLAFKDRMDWGKIIAAGLIVCGVILTRL